MKRLFLLLAVLCVGAAATVSAQDAKAIVARYNQVTGLDKITPAMETSVMMDVVTHVQGMTMPMKIVMKQPGKFRIDMEAAGQKMLMVTDGNKGWMSVPGQGTQPMPKESLEQLQSQTNMSQNYKWDSEAYEFELAGEVKEGGKTLLAVRFTPKKPLENIENMVVYFDKATGLTEYMTMVVTQNGQTMAARTDFRDYKKFGDFKIPSVYKVSMGGSEMMQMEIKELQYNYPVSDAMFAKPE